MKMNSVGIDLSENPGETLCPERICFYRGIIIVMPLHCGWIESNNNIQSKKYCQSRARPPSGAAAEKPNKEINWISDGARIFWQIETRICARIRQQLRLLLVPVHRRVCSHLAARSHKAKQLIGSKLSLDSWLKLSVHCHCHFDRVFALLTITLYL